MSVVSVLEINRSGSNTWKRHRQYKRVFLVNCSSMTDDAVAVGSATGIPALLSAYPTDPYAKVVNITASQKDMSSSPFQWTVEVQYDSQLDIDPAKTDENPLARPAIFEFSFEKASRAVRYDLDDNPINNSADMPIDPPLELELSIPIIKITINKATFSYPLVASLQDAVNSDSWLGFDPGQVKVRGIEAKEKWENNLLYWELQYTLAIKWDSWDPIQVLDQGFYEKTADGPKTIRDHFGAPLPHPSMLDGAGLKLTPGDPAVFLNFSMHQLTTFTGSIP